MTQEEWNALSGADKQNARDEAWWLFANGTYAIREILVYDNGGVEEIDPEDEFLGITIGQLDQIIRNFSLEGLRTTP
jgi:hypothetical protein